jgi:hypothetical protein
MMRFMVGKRSRAKLGLFGGIILALLTSNLAAHADETPSSKSGATEEQMVDARRQFEAGVSLLEDPDGAKYEEAYRAFKKAYELSHSPKVLGNIAFCAFHLERDGEAIDAYSTYLHDVPDISERERNQIQRDLGTLMATSARVKIVVKNPGSSFALLDRRTQIRGNPIENLYRFEGREISLRLRPGRHTFTVKTTDDSSRPVDAIVEPGSSVSYEVTFQDHPTQAPVPSERPAAPSSTSSAASLPMGPIVLGSVGLLALGTGVVTGLVARGKTSDIELKCPNDVCPSSYDLASDRTTAKTFGTIADVSFIGGGLLLGGAAVWYLLSPKASSSRTTATRTAWMCTHTGCSVNLQRTF